MSNPPPPTLPTFEQPSAKSSPTKPTADVTSINSSANSSSSSIHGNGSSGHLERPKMPTRKSSGTIIVPRDDPKIELQEGDEEFDEDDARAMSPRRNSEDLEKMSQEARAELSRYVQSATVHILGIC
jgi:hypothetical protein